ncbi:TAT-variant-translocated molybdopterin oxidoreductase [Pollutibacter soli]|uniref:TAT-variant-translocated molybdopterin oxidoreductase n=1 Tax=Pollutibacter soli TaxID=3034157 RepID=UPI0030137C0E
MEQKKYWQNFGELHNSKAYQESLGNEFEEELNAQDADDKGILDAKSPRRDFLKYLGFSTAAATLAASCEMPVKKSIPFLNKPENYIPGVADYYATTFVNGGDAIPVIAKVRDGRPIKIEGNELSTMTRGGTGAIAQASVLDLYDTARLRFPMGNGKEVTTFEAFDKMVSDALAGTGGLPVVLLTSTITSPSTKQIIAEFIAKFPGSRHVQYDALSASGILQANETSFGKRAIPSYDFGKAKVIVSLGADFLGTWLNSVEYANGYGDGRKINQANPEMSKHIHFESILSLTGANADDRYVHRPSEEGAVALALFAKLGGSVSAPALEGDRLKKGIDMAAAALSAAGGQALVVSGSTNPDVQVIVNAINDKIGAYGNTISWNSTLNTRQGKDSDMVQLVDDMNGGRVGAVLVCGVNPVYDYFDGKKFAEAFKKVKLTVSFNDREDETSELAKFILPDNHYLESWGDAEPKSGFLSFMQPTILPLFKTRQFQTSLLKWSGNNTDYEDYLKNYWVTRLGGQSAWDKALQDGVVETAGAAVSAAFNAAAVTDAAGKLASVKKGGKAELVLYPKVSMGSGRSANNPWLQEMPDPITKATWDNYAIISFAMAKELNIKVDDNYEVEVKKPVIKLTVAGKEPITIPILVVPGVHSNVIGLAVGYGRSEKTGRAAANVGKNAYPLVSLAGNNFSYSVADVAYEKLPDLYEVAYTQTHNQYEGRVEVVREYSLKEFKAKPKVLAEVREKLVEDYGGQSKDYRENGTLYPNYPYPGVKWGMSIDLNSCFGCGACTIACTAENNVPVVGKHEIARAHEMHWLRIDRYYATYRDDSGNDNLDDLNVVFMPMLCQHCDNAPCENVCPVNATNHSSEGLNQMTYNRCIGTRYCANNCPYKVRRFNWADYMGADSFPDNQNGKLSDATLMMNDDLSRMVLNPDVTVRSRGVIEKCSFCVQRLQEGKLKAKRENRAIETGRDNKWDVKTACQQACPTNAIVFGNVNDKNSVVSKIRNEEQTNRLYYSLEQLHVLPSVSYLAKIRNTDRQVGVVAGEHHAPATEVTGGHEEPAKH